MSTRLTLYVVVVSAAAPLWPGPAGAALCEPAPAITLTLTAVPTVACKGSTVTVSWSAVDPDNYLEPDQCMDCVTVTSPYGGGGPSGSVEVTVDWIGPTLLTFTADDNGCCPANSNDDPVSASVTVTGVTIGSMTGPNVPCVACLGQYTFSATTVPPGHCDLLAWEHDDGLDPGTGCEYSPTFSEPGQWGYCATVHCGSDARDICLSLAKGCAGTQASPDCATSEDNDNMDPGLPECVWGNNRAHAPMTGIGFAVCLDCSCMEWRVEVSKLGFRNDITYNWHGQQDADHAYNCQAATDTKTHLDDLNAQRPPSCEVQYVSRSCTMLEEEVHAQDNCAIFQDHAAEAIAQLAGLCMSATEPHCSPPNDLDQQASDIIAAMYARVAADIAACGEVSGREAHAACLQGVLGDICAHVPPGSCAACTQ